MIIEQPYEPFESDEEVVQGEEGDSEAVLLRQALRKVQSERRRSSRHSQHLMEVVKKGIWGGGGAATVGGKY